VCSSDLYREVSVDRAGVTEGQQKSATAGTARTTAGNFERRLRMSRSEWNKSITQIGAADSDTDRPKSRDLLFVLNDSLTHSLILLERLKGAL
jgi:hypothetical protein